MGSNEHRGVQLVKLRRQWQRWYTYVARVGRVTGRYGQRCQALVWGGGPGPRNVLVRFANGELTTVPARTLRRVKEREEL